VLTRSGQRRAFGGTLRFLVSVVTETLFFILLSPILWVCHTLFLAGLPFGRVIGWIGQVRDDHTVPWSAAWHQFWPHALIGGGAIAVLAFTHPSAIPYALLIAAGPALAVPLAVVTAYPAVGAALARIGLGRLPEETFPPAALESLSLPAVNAAAVHRARHA